MLTGRRFDPYHRLRVRAARTPDLIVLGPAERLLRTALVLVAAPIVIVGRFLDDRLQHAAAGRVQGVRFRCLAVRRQPREGNVIRYVENVLLHHPD